MENKTEKEMEKTGVSLDEPIKRVSPQVSPAKPKKQPKPKYKSRATRCGEAAGILNTAAGEIRGISEEITDLREEFEDSHEETVVEKLDEETTTKILELVGKVSAHFSDVESAKEKFEGLQGEMESWRDNMQGTNLETTDKYSRVDEAASNLSDVVSSIEQINEPDAPEATDGVLDTADVVSYTDELDTAANDIESAASDSENVDFPGMYG